MFCIARLLGFTSLVITVLLSGCSSGGGNSGGGDGKSSASFTISTSSVSFSGEVGFGPPTPKSVTGTITGVNTNIWAYIDAGTNGIVNFAEIVRTSTGAVLWIYPGDPAQLGEGTHRQTITIYLCYDEVCNSHVPGSPASVEVVYTVLDRGDEDPDGDGVPNRLDVFPQNPYESLDTDLDGIGNNTDTDDDGDNVPDSVDQFPLNPQESRDQDNDGIGDNSDPDADNDNVENHLDAFPLDPAESQDTDQDSIGNNVDTDDDNDGVPDSEDQFPLDYSESVDTDGDGIGNNQDWDDDNDGHPDYADALPLDPNDHLDLDQDGIGNLNDPDDDGDGVNDDEDLFPNDPNEWADTDGDTYGNNLDWDDDNDGYQDYEDALPLDPSDHQDNDGDLIGDRTDPDDDNDGIADPDDAFPLDETEWVDTDGDGEGDNIDTNDDNDHFADSDDPFPTDPSAPSLINKVSPAIVFVGETTKVVVSGIQVAGGENLLVDGVETSVTPLATTAVEVEVTSDAEGEILISTNYGNSAEDSQVSLQVVAPRNYPFANLASSGNKTKAIYDTLRNAIYVYDPQIQRVSRHQYIEGQGWSTINRDIADLQGIALSKDNAVLIGVRSDSLININLDTFSPGQIYRMQNENLSIVFDDIEFDHAGRAIIVTDYRGSGITSVIRATLTPDANQQLPNEEVGSLYDSRLAASGDGRLMLLSQYTVAVFPAFNDMIQSFHDNIEFVSASIDRNGSTVLMNNRTLYNRQMLLVGALDPALQITASDVAPSGEYTIAADDEGNIHWFDTTELNGEIRYPSFSVSTNALEIGDVTTIEISGDNRTAFVMGQLRTLVVPVWQIKENALGSAKPCPMAGCE